VLIVQGLEVKVFDKEKREIALQRKGGLWGNTRTDQMLNVGQTRILDAENLGAGHSLILQQRFTVSNEKEPLQIGKAYGIRKLKRNDS
jgi:hypothetical protein